MKDTSARSANPVVGPRYQFIAGATHASTLGLLQDIHAKNHREEAKAGKPADAGPVIEGALAGVLNFAALGGLSAAELEEDFVAMIRDLVPRIVMARAEAATPNGGGKA